MGGAFFPPLFARLSDGRPCLYPPVLSHLHRSLEVGLEPPAPRRVEETPLQKGVLLFLSTVGLLGSYVTWGFMQEMVRLFVLASLLALFSFFFFLSSRG